MADEFSNLLAAILEEGAPFKPPKVEAVEVPVTTPVTKKTTNVFLWIFGAGLFALGLWIFSLKRKQPGVREATVVLTQEPVEEYEEEDEEDVADVDVTHVTNNIMEFIGKTEDVIDVTGYELPKASRIASSTRLSDDSPEVENYAARRAALFRE